MGVMITERTLTPPFPVTLTLRPCTLALGARVQERYRTARFLKPPMNFLENCGVSLYLWGRWLPSTARRRNRPFRFAERYHLPFQTYTASEFQQAPGIFSQSEYVEKAVGAGNVCERAAVLAAKGILSTRARPIRGNHPRAEGRRKAMIHVAGYRAGGPRATAARAALEEAQVLVGYQTYIDSSEAKYPDKPVFTTGMTGEKERCACSAAFPEGKR